MKILEKKRYLIFVLLVALTVPAIYPLLHKGFFVSDDGEWMIIRLSAFFQTLRAGQFPVRFLGRLNFGYGYPVATFLYPGIMYLGSIIHLFKFGFVSSIKIVLGLSVISSIIFSYFWLKSFFDKFSSLFGSIVYIYTPYFLFDIYKRGSVGEVAALGVVPFILWQIERKSYFWSAVGLGILILMHNTLALLFLLLIVTVMVLRLSEVKNNRKLLIYRDAAIVLTGLGLSAFFWIPSLFELKYTVFSQTSISDYNQYFAPINLIGYSTFFILLIVLSITFLKKVNLKKSKYTLFIVIICILSVILSGSISGFLWKILPVSFIQFPFRILSLTIVCISYLAAFVANSLGGMYKKAFVVLSAILLFVSASQYITTVNYTDKGEGFYTTNDATTTVKDEYMPIWVSGKPLKSIGEKVEIVKGEGSINDLAANDKKLLFNTNLKSNSVIQINTVFWPGWNLSVDGNHGTIIYNNKKGLMQMCVPSGSHKINLNFGETPLRLTADIISVLSFILLIYLSKSKKFLESTKK